MPLNSHPPCRDVSSRFAVAEVEAEGSAEAQGDDVGPGQPPNQHAMSRMLGRLTSLLQGRPIRRMAANQARRIGNMISSNIGKLPLSLSARSVLR